MSEFLASNDWQWRLLRTIVQGVLGVVIAGEFGNGDERKRRLGANYGAVQRRVNEMLA